MTSLRVRWALIALAICFGQSAEAQLFPNLFIRRSRPDCDSEPASIKMHRDHYYGYQPTEWRRFPEGWGYRHPEVIDRVSLMKEVEEEVKKLEEEFGPGSREGDEGMGDDLPPRGRGRDDGDGGAAVPRPIPLPDDTESPFNLEPRQARPPANQPGDEPAPSRPARQPAAPELPAPGDSPFDIPGATPPKPADDLPPRPRTGTTPPVGMIRGEGDFTEVAVVEAPPEVMRAPQRSVIRDRLNALNPLGLIRR